MEVLGARIIQLKGGDSESYVHLINRNIWMKLTTY